MMMLLILNLMSVSVPPRRRLQMHSQPITGRRCLPAIHYTLKISQLLVHTNTNLSALGQNNVIITAVCSVCPT